MTATLLKHVAVKTHYDKLAKASLVEIASCFSRERFCDLMMTVTCGLTRSLAQFFSANNASLRIAHLQGFTWMDFQGISMLTGGACSPLPKNLTLLLAFGLARLLAFWTSVFVQF